MPQPDTTPLNHSIPKRIFVFGEVVADVMPNGQEVIGGAPMNVAWNLRGLGQHPNFITAVGADELGKTILRSAETWGLATNQIQIDPDHPTGKIYVSYSDNEPSYEIPLEQAYDYIRRPDALIDTVNETEDVILYHGSMACRSEVSCATLLDLRQSANQTIVVDINLRDGQYQPDVLDTLITGATVLKCNHEELAYLANSKCRSTDQLLATAKSFLKLRSLRELWVTAGADGAFWMNDSGDEAFLEPPAVTPQHFKDSVGAGDAFMAAVLSGLATDESRKETLAKAIQISAAVCTLTGATTTNGDFYERFSTLPLSD